MLLEGVLRPVAPVAPEPLEPPCEKPEQPTLCEVGFASRRPCFANTAEIQWNSAVGYWYCVSLFDF